MKTDCLFFLCFWVLLSQVSCRQAPPLTGATAHNTELEMKATIEKVLLYDSLPSASGLELLGDQYYVIGDDSPYLYRLDEDYKLLSQVALFDTTGFGATGRIAKSEKPDLESMTLFQYQGKPYLLMLGSGSSPERRKAFLSNICGDSLCREGSTTKEVDLDALYKQLETQEVLGESTLNIEGVAAGHGKLYLLQRAIGSGQNVLITFSLGEFIPYLLGESGGRIPKHELAYFRLPELKNLQAGFSGAFVYDDKLFFTASLEDTQDAIGDGEVLGSYVGFIPFREIGKQDSLEVPATLIVQADGKPYAGKAESLVVKKREGKGRYRLVVVSDDDKGGSELLEISLTAGQ